MKNLLPVILFLLSSCSNEYYQVFQTNYGQNLKEESERIVFENDDAKISYNFWGENGRMSFRFYNKTDKPIFINTEQCYFIRNGLALTYYTPESTRKEVGNTLVIQPYASGMSQTYREESTKGVNVISVPNQSYVIIGTKEIAPLMFEDCGLDRYPSSKGSSLTFKGVFNQVCQG